MDEHYQTVLLVAASQPYFDNGGLEYFFESDWQGNPPYSLFADAFDRVGRPESAQSIRDAAASFGFDQPEKNLDGRLDMMDMHQTKEGYSTLAWDQCACGDKVVWDNLVAYIRKHGIGEG